MSRQYTDKNNERRVDILYIYKYIITVVVLDKEFWKHTTTNEKYKPISL